MNDIKNIIEMLMANFTSPLQIEKLGKVNKIIGNRYFITPNDKNIEAISLSIINDHVNRIGVVLLNSITLERIEKGLDTTLLSIGYSWYDDLSFFNFKYNNKTVSSIKEGDYRDYRKKENVFVTNSETINIEDVYFDRFEIR